MSASNVCAHFENMQAGDSSSPGASASSDVKEEAVPLETSGDGFLLDGVNLNEELCQSKIDAAQYDIQEFGIGTVPEPIKELDNIISEFDEADSFPPIVHNGENQSEDDGYMSLSRKNMSNKNVQNEVQDGSEPFQSFQANGIAKNCVNGTEEGNLIQSTLPKVRSSLATSSHYSSLPSCGGRSTPIGAKVRVGSCNGERNVLGIDISAVHDAVLRGGLVKLPETIVNEHPVTIYPGRCSPTAEAGTRNSRIHRKTTYAEKHKEVSHIVHRLSSVSSSSSTTSSSSEGVAPLSTKDYVCTTEYICKNDEPNAFVIDQRLSPLIAQDASATQLKTYTPTGIAWEIYFERKRNARDAKKNYFVKNESESISQTNIISSNVYLNEFETKNATSNYDVHTGNNFCSNMNSEQSNKSMLGKGTFVIRKTPKKAIPTAMDIFQISTANPEKQSISCITDHIPKSQILTNHTDEIHKKPNATDSSNSSRYSLEFENVSSAATYAPQRDRLSLNLESQQMNSLITSMEAFSPLKETRKFPTDDIRINGSSDSEQSTNEESTNCMDLRGEKNTVAANSFDICNTFGSYKSSELKNQEYTDIRNSNTNTPHTDLAPTLEEDEELSDFSYGCAPLKQIESNISALLRGDIAVARLGVGNGLVHQKRPLEFRPGVHKSESAKEMLLSQNTFGPLPPSPGSSSPEPFDYDARLPPLPPLPALPPSPAATPITKETHINHITAAEIHMQPTEDKKRVENIKCNRHLNDNHPLAPLTFDDLPPAVPPHRGGSYNTIKSWSIDSKYKNKRSPRPICYDSNTTSAVGQSVYESGAYSTKRYVSYGTKRGLKQSPREEYQHRLQTSCSLPETPIFARGCDIPRTPYRREHENGVCGSRTAPRSGTAHNINMGNSIVGIASLTGGNSFGAGMCRQRSINHALASNEMLRLSGAPGRGWYPKQRAMRPASTEHIDRLATMRVWDSAAGMSGTGHARKPLTLPPNLTPSFLNKSPREALRRVTSLLITKKKNSKECRNKPDSEHAVDLNYAAHSLDKAATSENSTKAFKTTTQKNTKKKGIFKNIWKKTKHFSIDQ